MLVILTGKPGTGKTLTMTDYARRYFREDNPPLRVWFTEKILRKKWIYKLRIYSDYPITFLEPKKGRSYLVYNEEGIPVQVDRVSSLICRVFDLTLKNKFIDGAKFFFDETRSTCTGIPSSL